MRTVHEIGYIALAVGSLLAGCRGSSAESTAGHGAPQATVPAQSLDGRTPIPLTAMMANHQKQEMRDHLRVVQEITSALTKDDFDAIAASAARIGWSDKQAMMCKHMGAGAPGFAEAGQHFHETADGIAAAARRRDRAGVVSALDATLQTCVGCHESYRQDIVDEVTFAKRGSSMGGMDPSSMMHAN
ncbi:MAG: cytochrome c [Kofleriaceae bacterium]